MRLRDERRSFGQVCMCGQWSSRHRFRDAIARSATVWRCFGICADTFSIRFDGSGWHREGRCFVGRKAETCGGAWPARNQHFLSTCSAVVSDGRLVFYAASRDGITEDDLCFNCGKDFKLCLTGFVDAVEQRSGGTDSLF